MPKTVFAWWIFLENLLSKGPEKFFRSKFWSSLINISFQCASLISTLSCQNTGIHFKCHPEKAQLHWGEEGKDPLMCVFTSQGAAEGGRWWKISPQLRRQQAAGGAPVSPCHPPAKELPATCWPLSQGSLRGGRGGRAPQVVASPSAAGGM